MTLEIDKWLDKLIEKLSTWGEQFILHLPNLVIALVVIVAFVALAKLGQRVVDKVLGRVSDNRQIRGLLSRSAHVAIIAIGIFIALGVLDLDKTVTSLLAGAGILGLALGFAFQDLGANIISGVYMAVRRPFKVGDLIETNGHTGKVDAVLLRSTTMRTLQGQEVIIPNKEIFENPIVNYTTTGERRLDVACGVAYGDDLEEVRDIALGAVRGLEGIESGRDPELFFNEFGGSSINFTLRLWLTSPGQRHMLKTQSEVIIALKKAFDSKGVTIPFPIRTLDFGVVGGEPLAKHLPWDKMMTATSKERAPLSRGSDEASAA